VKWLFWIAGLYSFVVGVKFGPGLFKKDHPDLVFDRFGEGGCVMEIRNVFVHVDGHPLAFVKHLR
jgi:hypothetical protein